VKCPKCGLINDEGVAHCDCGYNFATGVRDASFVRRRRRWRNWSRNKVLLIVGSFVLVEAIAWFGFGGLLLPGGLWLLAIIGYLMTWEDIKS
jgi:hypothetical protein